MSVTSKNGRGPRQDHALADEAREGEGERERETDRERAREREREMGARNSIDRWGIICH